MTPTLAGRFWSKVAKSNGCWTWTGNACPKGYGKIRRGPRGSGTVLAHRLSWEMHNGPISDGLWVLHLCDNPSCVRPDHLFLGDALANNLDCLRKDRGNRRGGERHHFAKLTASQVETIRRRLAEGALGVELAREYRVHERTVSQIRNGRSWRAA